MRAGLNGPPAAFHAPDDTVSERFADGELDIPRKEGAADALVLRSRGCPSADQI
jgi:hypothetical protein